MTNDIDTQIAIGSRLRALRRKQVLSLDATAARTGVSKAMLGQIERSESSPTIATLWKIATGLAVPLSYFLNGPTEPSETAVTRPATGAWLEDRAGMRTRTLFPFDPALGFEMFEVVFNPGAESRSEPHAAGSIEQIRVTEGTLIVEIGETRHHLEAGDALRFPGDRPHRYQNISGEIVRAMDLIHYPG